MTHLGECIKVTNDHPGVRETADVGQTTQACSTDGCNYLSAFRSRSKPAWCLACIDEILDTAGLEPAAPFTGPREWRLTTCLACGVQAHYRLEYIVDNNRDGRLTCRACHWKRWAADSRARPGDEFERTILSLLEQFTPEQIMEGNPHPDVRQFLESQWWSPERIAAHLDANNFELITLTVDITDGNDPIVTRCRLCQRIEAQRLTDVGWGCTCSRNTRHSNPGSPRPGRVLLLDSQSEALAWWDHDRNTESDLRTVTVLATRSAHWACPECRHRFPAKVSTMAERPTCPECSARRQAEWSLQLKQWETTPIADVPELAAAWADDGDPRRVMVADSFPLRRFRCGAGHHPRIAPYRLLTDGCPHCRARVSRTDRKWLADTQPEIASQWHPTRNGSLGPADLVWDSRRTAWWRSDCCGHEWQSSPRDRDKRQRLRCPACRTILGSLAWEQPDIAEEWSSTNPVTAWQVRPNTATGFVPEWVCASNPEHIWWSPLSSRSTGASCPDCRVTGKSRVELDHHASAVETFGDARSGIMLREPAFVNRPSWTADIGVDFHGRTLLVEYDGAYWHASPEKTFIDERKTRDLLRAGHLVVRLREDGLCRLPITHPRYKELRVYATAPRPGQVMTEIKNWAFEVMGSSKPESIS